MSTLSTIDFHGQELIAINHGGELYTAIKPICENIGVDWEAQRKRIMRDEVLSSTASMMEVVAGDGKSRDMLCLPLHVLNGWLFGIDDKRVKAAARPALLMYKRECYAALYEYWHGKSYSNYVVPTPELNQMFNADYDKTVNWLTALQKQVHESGGTLYPMPKANPQAVWAAFMREALVNHRWIIGLDDNGEIYAHLVDSQTRIIDMDKLPEIIQDPERFRASRVLPVLNACIARVGKSGIIGGGNV